MEWKPYHCLQIILEFRDVGGLGLEQKWWLLTNLTHWPLLSDILLRGHPATYLCPFCETSPSYLPTDWLPGQTILLIG